MIVLKRTLIAFVKEALRSAALLLLVTLAMFAVLSTAPGDPVSLFVNVQSLSADELAEIRHELGLDRSLPARYGAWLLRLSHGDLGTSLRSGQPVTVELWRTGWRTLLLAGSAMLLTLFYATMAAALSALGRRPILSAILTSFGYVLSGLPVFWLGYLAIYIATTRFKVFPVMMGVSDTSTWSYFWVPVVVLGLGNGTVSEVTRYLRTHLSTVLAEDYIRTARAKGAVLLKHLYKDGFVMPLTSLLANKIPYVLSGAIVVEQVFNWPGMGRLAWQAASDRDYPILLGVVLVSALFVRAAHVIKGAVQVAVNPQLAE
ncbi:MAG: ABC transporter permease [Vicinamibacteria bacterium]|nr:ABC transporter permease [Vicinamibacteria bacterium]